MLSHQPGVPGPKVGNQNSYVPGLAHGHDHTRVVSSNQYSAHNSLTPHGAKPAEVAAAEPTIQSE